MLIKLSKSLIDSLNLINSFNFGRLWISTHFFLSSSHLVKFSQFGYSYSIWSLQLQSLSFHVMKI